MIKPKVVTGFARLSKEELLARSQAIRDGLKGNSNFPNPEPTLEVLEAALKAYEDALAAFTTNGGKGPKALRDEKAEDLIAVLELLALYVQMKCNGDLSVLLSSGFESRRSKSTRPPLGKPQNLRAIRGVNPAEVKVTVDRVDGAVTYFFEFRKATDPDTVPWERKFSTKAFAEFSGLTSRTDYHFQVGAVGKDGETVLSDVITFFVL
jgi:hypothetical protein